MLPHLNYVPNAATPQVKALYHVKCTLVRLQSKLQISQIQVSSALHDWQKCRLTSAFTVPARQL